MKKIFTFLFAALVFVSCNNTKKSTVLGDEKAGKDIIGWYYYNVMQDSYDSIPKLMNEDFYNDQQQAEFIKTLKERDSAYGNITSFVLDKWEMTDRDKKAKTKDFYFEYKVKYENEPAEVVEKIYLAKKGNDLKISKFEFSK
ncbi:hypothetical protein HX017_04280 [Myroides marinus]|uniref:DUF3887 domain-containing protein n=1 Tax=Myroides marinus TaxID=703342 RepID=A0A165RMU5_9FLAO|nr:hypothetical protein [Myroides marinus]KZE83767.1 hypothetical protein AV926_03635 [Myroides marinus]MDM1351337.1 hypothetical protein [Myroides marinus]MDM1354025.1 hypothetical protein [Myroides marinus]MDM1358544.1 hypothetical protein [Myroides marinus]MDM1361412.1 hypothetical protein [Myroides marinus]